MNDGLKNCFSLVDTRSERQRAYKLLIDSDDEIQILLQDKSLINCKGQSLKDNFIILWPHPNLNRVNSDTDVIVTFALGKEKYFLKTKLLVNSRDQALVDLSQPLYKLQRRTSFRVRVPTGYGARAEIDSINDTHVRVILPIGDLSSGGCSLEMTPSLEIKIEKEQNIKGFILVGGKFKKSFEAIVKHIGNVGSKGSGLIRAGIEFQNVSTSDKEAFMKITMDIQRDMFSTFKIGTR